MPRAFTRARPASLCENVSQMADLGSGVREGFFRATRLRCRPARLAPGRSSTGTTAPTGRMKSREGTVVDADDFIQEMIETAKTIAKDLGKF